jgi:hypothetical protein
MATCGIRIIKYFISLTTGVSAIAFLIFTRVSALAKLAVGEASRREGIA